MLYLVLVKMRILQVIIIMNNFDVIFVIPKISIFSGITKIDYI